MFFSCISQKKNIKKSQHHFAIAVELIKTHCDNPRALSHLLKAIHLNPRDVLIRHTLGLTYYVMEKYTLAAKELLHILKQNPKFTEARVDLALIYIEMNKADLALKQLAKAKQDLTYPNSFKLLFLQSLGFYKTNQYKKTDILLQEISAIPSAKNCTVYLLKGKTSLAMGELATAEKTLKTSLRICEKERKQMSACNKKTYLKRFAFEAHLLLGRLYIKKEDTNRAKYHLNLFLQKVKKGKKYKQAKKLLKTLS